MSIRNYISTFLLLSWKNHKTQWNQPIELLWLILSPVLLVLIAAGLRIFTDVKERVNTYYDPVDLNQSWSDLMDTLQERQNIARQLNRTSNVFMPELTMAWAPNDYNIFAKIMEIAMRELYTLTLRNFSDCTDMEQAMQKDFLFAGICFEHGQYEKTYTFKQDQLAPDEMILPQLNYTIVFPSELRIFEYTFIGDSWKTIYQEDPKTSIIRRLNQPHRDGYVYYVREGFMRVQKAITESFLKVVATAPIPEIVLRRFPVIGRKHDPLMNYLNRALPLLIIIGFLFPAQILVWQVVKEKQQQLRLYLINMNIGNILHFSAWYCKCLVYMLISSILVVAVIKIEWKDSHGVLTQTPWFIVLGVMCMYSVAATSFCLMVASFFKNCSLAIRVITILWLLTYLPFFVLWNNQEKAVVIIRYLACAFPNTVLALVFEVMIEREVIFEKGWVDQGYSLNYAASRINVYLATCIFLGISVVYSAIGIYMDVWNTGELGGRRRKTVSAPAHSGDYTYQDRMDSFMPQSSQSAGAKPTKIYEVEPSHRHFKIKIKKLCKRYAANSRGALNSFTWNVYENEVTVLMGHNGCGKTTLLKILAGLLEPSRGLVNIANYNIQTERHDASMQMGLALNDDLLFSDFTVADQIRFICIVKGCSWSMSKEEVELYTELLQISHLRSTKVYKLSAQERTLLCICCAFAGGSPIILIDDLQPDLDLASQANIAKLINEEKTRRTIILVSNSTDMANSMADRLAIMCNGELKCTGTKPFLRNMYGHGFRLTCIKGKSCDILELYNLMKLHIPNLTVESDIGYKITFILETKYEEQFPQLFDALEDNMLNLDIISFRLRDTSLDEIFLRFGSEDADQIIEPTVLIDDFRAVLEESDSYARAEGKPLMGMRLRALLYMYWIFNKRQLPIKIVNVVALLMATLCTFAALLLYGKNYQLVPISFNLTQLHHIYAFVEPMADNPTVKEMEQFYKELLFWYDGRVQELKSDEISDYYLLEQNDFSRVLNFRYMFGASIGDKEITTWYNNIPLHAPPFSLNLVHNMVARRFFNEEASIDVTLRPLPFQSRGNSFPQSPLGLGSLFAINLSFVFSNVWPGPIINSVSQRAFKKQQFLAGVGLYTYCIATALFDFLRVILISLFLVLLTSIYLNPRHDVSFYVALLLVLIISGYSIVALAYFLSAFFKAPHYAFIVICFLSALGIIVFTITVGDKLSDMNYVYQVFTQYSFGKIVFKLFYIYEYKYMCKDSNIAFVSKDVEQCKSTPDCCQNYDYWDTDLGVGLDFIIMLLLVILPLALFLLQQHYTLLSCVCLQRRRKQREQRTQAEAAGAYMLDDSVIAERQRIAQMQPQQRANYAVICQNVGKRFNKKQQQLLLRIDLCIANSECVGLMGYNNSGKTTLLRLLIGELRATHGRIWIGGYSMETQRSKCYPLMGYCAQHERLPDELTPRELLNIHALLRGYAQPISLLICEGLARVLGFYNCYRQLLRLCTSGQRRRIAFALALLGEPTLICIDGPPGGIDPNGRRILFGITAFMQERGCAFIYTNLSGLDCERLCQRNPVLFEGQLWTIGTQEQRYRRGYLLEIRFKSKVNADVTTARATWEQINQFPMSPHNKCNLFMQVKFPDAKL
ncbi:CG1494, partial [Drosophila busckii]